LVRISAAFPIHSSNCRLAEQALEPARVSAGFHAYTYLQALLSEFAVELLGFFAMR